VHLWVWIQTTVVKAQIKLFIPIYYTTVPWKHYITLHLLQAQRKHIFLISVENSNAYLKLIPFKNTPTMSCCQCHTIKSEITCKYKLSRALRMLISHYTVTTGVQSNHKSQGTEVLIQKNIVLEFGN